jgi:hypothetical protein
MDSSYKSQAVLVKRRIRIASGMSTPSITEFLYNYTLLVGK